MMRENGIKPNRISWIDNCKGLATILVVLGHCMTDFSLFPKTADILPKWFAYFHVPLFFMVAGYVLAMKPNAESFGKFIIKKAKRLLVPFWLFSLIYWLEIAAFKMVSGRGWLSYLLSNLVNLINGQGGGVLWFLSCMFIAEVIFYFLAKVKRTWAMTLIATAIMLTGLYVTPLYNVLRRSLIAVGFLMVGYLLYKFFPKKNLSIIVVAICGCLFNILGVILNGKVDLSGLNFGKSEILYFVFSSAACIGVMAVFMLIKKPIPIVSYYGRESMTVYCVHMPIIELLWMINNKLLHWRWFQGAVMAVVALAICVPAILVINKWLPWSVGVWKKKVKK